MTGLCTLRQLDLDHLDLWLGSGLRKPLGREAPVPVAATEIAASHLPDDVAAALLVMDAEAALAGVMCKAPGLSTPVEGSDGVG